MTPPPDSQDRRWALCVAGATMLLTLVPYLYGASFVGTQPRFGWYAWLPYNFEDSAVYLGWARQAQDGHFFLRNPFTTDPQSGLQFNFFCLALGAAARLLHLPLLFLLQAARLVFGWAFLHVAWWLVRLWVCEAFARRCAFLLICFSSGLGWLVYALRVPPEFTKPVDLWQPETITFLSLAFNSIFAPSLMLIGLIAGCLWQAQQRRAYGWAAAAGLCGLVLGNMHPYDVVAVYGAWGLFLALQTVPARRIDWRAWLRYSLAAAPAALSAGYIGYLIRTDPVFARTSKVETLSAGPLTYVLGYGLVFALALVGLWLALRPQPLPSVPSPNRGGEAEIPPPLSLVEKGAGGLGSTAALFLLCWISAHFIAAYLPVAFQRKMVMGAHIPLAILAGVALAHLIRRSHAELWRRRTTLCLAVILLSLSNVQVVQWVLHYLPQDRSLTSPYVRPFAYAGEIGALDRLRELAPPGAALQPLPWVRRFADGRVQLLDYTLAVAAPGLTGHPVHAGHSYQTPDFDVRIGQWMAFVLPETADAQRLDLLRRSGVKYVLFSQRHVAIDDNSKPDDPARDFRAKLPAFLKLIPEASNADAEVYEFRAASVNERSAP